MQDQYELISKRPAYLGTELGWLLTIDRSKISALDIWTNGHKYFKVIPTPVSYNELRPEATVEFLEIPKNLQDVIDGAIRSNPENVEKSTGEPEK